MAAPPEASRSSGTDGCVGPAPGEPAVHHRPGSHGVPPRRPGIRPAGRNPVKKPRICPPFGWVHRRFAVFVALLTGSWTVMSLATFAAVANPLQGGFMRHRARSILAVGALLIGTATLVPAAHARPASPPGTSDTETQGDADPGSASGEVKVFRATVTRQQVPLLLAAGQDAHELGEQVPAGGRATVEVQLTGEQAAALREQGVPLVEHSLSARSEKRVAAAAEGVFRPYSGSGGLKEEILRTAREHPGLTKAVSIGRTVKGQDILALKITRNARTSADGSRPAVLYMSNQHAREWITPEMTRRLMHHYLDRYDSDKRIRRIVDSTELWFVLSANPDGYDYTFRSPSTRLWRKNLRDVNGDGVISTGDGVDLNRNFAYKWGYDDEGSSPEPTSETYRGAAPASEPETRALDALQKRIGFRYAINYHSAAELLLYGVGWQVATPTPDDVLYRALAGTPENSAIPGYHPQLSSELYTTNGEADGHAANVNGVAMFTPEMSTCQTASDADPDDAWEAADCRSVFTFPDDEKLIQREFVKNVPFALSVAETAAHPDTPVSTVGLDAADFTPAKFTTSYSRGGDQQVAVTVRKALRDKELKYRVNGGRTEDMALRPLARRRDLRRRRQPVLRRVPGHRQGRRPGRQGRGVVHRRDPRRPEGLQRALHLHRGRASSRRRPRRRRGRRPRHAGTGLHRRPEGGRTQGRRLGRRHPGRPRRAGRAEPLRHRRPLHGRLPARQRHPAPAAGLPQRGRPADRGGRAGRRQRRPGRRQPVGRLQPVLAGRVLPYVHAGRHRLHRLRTSRRRLRLPRRRARQPAGRGRQLRRHLRRAARRPPPAVREQRRGPVRRHRRPVRAVRRGVHGGGRAHRRRLQTPHPHRRPHRGHRGRGAHPCACGSSGTPSAATTTRSSRRTPSAATTGRPCRRRAEPPRTPYRGNAPPVSTSGNTPGSPTTSP
ncbi:hypothetical protein GCM10020256_59550 [Streptomyces thermocoprophilus]